MKYYYRLIFMIVVLFFICLFSLNKNIVLSQSQTISQSENENENIIGDEQEKEFEEVAGEATENYESQQSDQGVSLKQRRFTKKVTVNNRTKHLCEAEDFVIDISRKSSTKTKIWLKKSNVAEGILEIGGLPSGIDMFFSANSDYTLLANDKEQKVELDIIKQDEAQKGSFSLTIFYTDKENNSTTICQINVINY